MYKKINCKYNNIMDWNDFYKLPLKLDPEPYCSYAWDKEDNMTLMFDYEVDRVFAQNVVDCINGVKDFKIKDLIIIGEIDFFKGDNFLFCVRGWGGLTGVGGLDLSFEEAAKIQDDFTNFIFKKLT